MIITHRSTRNDDVVVIVVVSLHSRLSQIGQRSGRGKEEKGLKSTSWRMTEGSARRYWIDDRC